MSIFTNSVAFFTGGNDNGSAHNINGTTIVITLFISDVEYGWDIKAQDDAQRMNTVNEYLAMAGDYLEEQVGSYGGEAVFITDFIANDDLAYYVRVNRNMENDSSYGANEEAVWDSIDEYIDVEALKTKYQADN
ncbi:MAG: hypothetical protein IKP14_10580, partial [Clostridiales bacterium]|nr:hypothetical protein [Clostridiales bacterium]